MKEFLAFGREARARGLLRNEREEIFASGVRVASGRGLAAISADGLASASTAASVGEGAGE